MEEFGQECLETFLKNQGQLFDQPIAETIEEAAAFLEESLAVVVDTIEEVREYLLDAGADVEQMTEEDLREASEVFELPDGRFLIVEG
ncbi:MAG: glyoxalase [Lachnospiraceae bacterium]